MRSGRTGLSVSSQLSRTESTLTPSRSSSRTVWMAPTMERWRGCRPHGNPARSAIRSILLKAMRRSTGFSSTSQAPSSTNKSRTF
jgi:hypothetical protein